VRISKEDVPVRFSAPGATARQKTDFGDAADYGKIGGEYFSLDAGTDVTALLKGLEGDLCQSPHWGYMIEGELVATYADGSEETVLTGDLFHWPPGHTIRAEQKSEIIMFSPEHEHGQVMDHIKTCLQG
jgi:hypothetical protein